MNIVALDWNASRVRAVRGEAGGEAHPVPLEPPGVALPLALDLEREPCEIGAAVLRRSRVAAGRVCQGFLPYLTEKPGHGPRWQAGRRTLDSQAVCERIWQRLQPAVGDAGAIVLGLPDYLRPVQANALRKLGEKSRLPIVGTAPVALLAALSARGTFDPAGAATSFWDRSVLVLDVDEHALTLGWVKAIADKAQLVESRSFPHLGLRFWRERLLDSLADLFIRSHRRDPRDTPQAEQMLFDQLEILADACQANEAIHVGVQGREWYKHVLVTPDLAAQSCHALTAQAAGETERLFESWSGGEWPPRLIVTHAAARLPGVIRAIRGLTPVNASAETRLPQIKATEYDDFDFGENLLIDAAEPTIAVLTLPADAPARTAHALAGAFIAGTLPRGHLEMTAPLAPTIAPEPHRLDKPLSPLRIAGLR